MLIELVTTSDACSTVIGKAIRIRSKQVTLQGEISLISFEAFSGEEDQVGGNQHICRRDYG